MIPQQVTGWPLIRSRLDVESVESTNDLAREYLDQPELLPMMIVAREQTKGRGRGDNTWWSDRGSILLTYVLNPLDHGIAREQFSLIGLAVALAVLDALFGCEPSARLRWPNDIEAGGRKLGGILPELVETQNGPRMIVGLGLNLTTALDKAPPEVAVMATSIEAIWPPARFPLPTRDELLGEIAFDLTFALKWLSNGDPAFVQRLNQWDALRGQPVTIALPGETCEGIGAGITSDGGLKVLTKSGIEIIYGGRVLRQ